MTLQTFAIRSWCRAHGADTLAMARQMSSKHEEGGVSGGVEGDARGLDKQNNGRGVPFEMRASVLQVASIVLLHGPKTWVQEVLLTVTRPAQAAALLDASLQLTDSE